MKIDDIKVGTKKIFRIKSQEIASLESSMWITFPEGYREYMTKLGDGILGSFVRIYTPAKIERELPKWRQRINQNWFWDRGKKILPKERALECVVIGDTTSGDELVFHPSRPDKLLVLPSESEQVYEAGDDLMSALEWICTSGKLVEKIFDLDFSPTDSKKEKKRNSKKESHGSVNSDDSISDIAGQARQWITAHSIEKHARKELKDFLRPGQELKLVQEGIGWSNNQPAYVAVFKIKDKQTGRLAGVLAFHTEDGVHGGGERLA